MKAQEHNQMKVGMMMKEENVPVREKITKEYNQYGNVSKLQIEKSFAEKQGEREHTFYYRIEKEAGLSVDEKTKEMFPVYCQVKIIYEHELSAETLHDAHHYTYVLKLSEEHDIDVEYITPITKETYENGMKG